MTRRSVAYAWWWHWLGGWIVIGSAFSAFGREGAFAIPAATAWGLLREWVQHPKLPWSEVVWREALAWWLGPFAIPVARFLARVVRHYP